MGTDWISKIYERPDESPQEGVDPDEETVGPRKLLRGETQDRAPASATMITGTDTDADAKPAKATMTMKGEWSPSLPQDVQQERADIREKELNFSEAQSFTRLNAGRALAQTKAQAQEILADDFNEMDRLNKEHYARWETENAQFRADIDDARQLRVNPNNYMQNIGRSGRVSSVLAAAASQMAAGAGNPNMAWNRIKATIDQDIATQKANIELEFSGIAAGQGQQDREAAMLGKYYSFEEKSRAVAMTALEAQVAIIQQRAVNEMEYQGYQMIRDRASAEAIDASAAAMAKDVTLYLDAPTHRAYQALVNAKRYKAAQAMLQDAYSQQEGAAREVDTAIQSYDAEGRPVTFDTPEDQALAVEAPERPVEAAAAPRATRVARDQRPQEAPVSPEEPTVTPAPTAEAQAVAAERPLTPEEAAMEHKLGGPAGAPAALAPSPEDQAAFKAEAEAEKQAAAEDKQLRVNARAAQIEAGIRQRMGSSIQTSYRHEELKRLNMKPQDFNTFLEARDIILDPTNPEISVFPSYADAKEGLKYDTRTGAKANYERGNPELYEDYTFLEHEGTKTKPRWIEQNYVQTAWGKLKLARTSTFRHDTATRDEFRKKVNNDFLRAQDIQRQAKAIRAHGTGQIFGLQVGKDGIEWIGTGTGAESMSERLAGKIGLGIRAMKQLDPSGRLTDKDIEVGITFMTALLENPTMKVWETLSSIYRNVMGKDPTKSAVRDSLVRVLGATAGKLSDAIAIEHVGDIVMDFDQHTKFDEDRKDIDKWLRSSKKDK
jgi:hypothetical protein